MKNGLNYKNYHGSVDFSAEDQVLYGKIVGIRDLVTFEGTSVAEINAAFKEAVDDYIETCRKSAKEPEKAFKGSFNVRVKPNIHRLVSMKAQALKISLNQYVESVLEEAVAADYREPEIETPTTARENPPVKIANRSRKKRAGARRKK
jgi:predicted HicB family RNase H-like nuclease